MHRIAHLLLGLRAAGAVKRACILCIFLALAAPGLLFAQDEGQASIDDLFSTPDSVEAPEETGDEQQSSDEQGETDADKDGANGTQEEAPDTKDEGEAAEKVDLDALTTAPPKVTGSVTGAIGAGAGLIEWPGSSAAEGRDIKELDRYSGFFKNDVTVKFDVRPKPYIRFHTSLKTSLNDESMNYSTPNIGEIFMDYTLGDTVFFRAGKQSLTWGQGRLLDNPANLVSRVSGGVAFRSTFPAWRGSAGAVVYTNSGWVKKHNNYDPKAFAYAAQWENTFGPLTLDLMGHFQTDENIGSAAALSFGLGSFNIAADLAAEWDRDEPLDDPIHWQAMGQVGWDHDDPDWSLLAEYQYDSQVEDHQGHRAAIAVKMPHLYKSDWRPQLRWKHAFQDTSGEIVAGIEGGIAPSLKLSLAVPVIYGEPGSFYREALSEGVTGSDNDDDDEYKVPVDNVVSLLASIKISFSF